MIIEVALMLPNQAHWRPQPGIVYPDALEDISIVAAVKLVCVYGLVILGTVL